MISSIVRELQPTPLTHEVLRDEAPPMLNTGVGAGDGVRQVSHPDWSGTIGQRPRRIPRSPHIMSRFSCEQGEMQ